MKLCRKLMKHLGFALLAIVSQTACAAESVELMSAGALEINSENVLFVGDNKAGVVHAFELPTEVLRDQNSVSLGRSQTFEGRTLVHDIDQGLADLLGTSTDQIQINDMIVREAGKQIFMSVHAGRGPNPTAAIVTIDDGELQQLDLASAKHTHHSVGEVPQLERLEFGQFQNMFAITDIDYYNGELFVAGLSNGAFASKLRRIKYPFSGEMSESSIEIWHAVHAQFETRAPIISQTIETLDGVPTLVAVYACTPLVRIPIAKLENGARVRGEMIGELGFGNTPIDIISYRDPSDNKDYVLVTNTNRSATRVSLDEITLAKPMPVDSQMVFTPSGVSQFQIPVTKASHIDVLDSQWVAVIRENPHDATRTDLHTLPLPFFFDRADHIVEMNWPGAPDPYGYSQQKDES